MLSSTWWLTILYHAKPLVSQFTLVELSSKGAKLTEGLVRFVERQNTKAMLNVSIVSLLTALILPRLESPRKAMVRGSKATMLPSRACFSLIRLSKPTSSTSDRHPRATYSYLSPPTPCPTASTPGFYSHCHSKADYMESLSGPPHNDRLVSPLSSDRNKTKPKDLSGEFVF